MATNCTCDHTRALTNRILRGQMLAHNLFLTAFSAILVFLVAQTAVNVWQEHGFDAIWSDNTVQNAVVNLRNNGC